MPLAAPQGIHWPGIIEEILESARFRLQLHDRQWSAITLGAESKQKELVPGRTKTAWQLRLERRDAPFKLIQLLTLVALEVMVMFFPGYLISCRITGNLYRLQPTLID